MKQKPFLLVADKTKLLSLDPDPDHYADPDPGEPNQCVSGSETAVPVKTVIRKVGLKKKLFITFMIPISQRYGT
jgi:hypothetical protein